MLRTLLREYPYQTAHSLSRLNDFICEARHLGNLRRKPSTASCGMTPASF
jgi:hypothetical protein